MQKFFTDKSKIFECNISVEGANLSETKARLILEFPNNRNLMFHGNIDKTGKCKVNIPALKEMSEVEGNVILEVIAESNLFESWKDKFKLEASKKVCVEMVENDKDIIDEEVEPQIKPHVEVITEDIEEAIKEDENNVLFENYSNYLKENKIEFNSLVKNKKAFLNSLVDFKKARNMNKEDVIVLAEGVKNMIKNNKKIL